MQSAPPKLAETLLGWLIPPACREHVLGDLHERYESPRQYIAEAALTVPMVIASQIHRTTDFVVRFMEAFVLYGSFVTAASAGGNLLKDDWGLLRLAIPAAITLLVLVFADAYADPAKRPPLRPALGVILGLTVTCLVEAALAVAGSALALPNLVMLCGAGFSLLLVSTLRMIFPPFADRPRGANGPVFWQDQEIAGVNPRLIRGLAMIAVIVVAILVVSQFWRQG